MKGREKITMGRGKISTSANVWGTDMSFRYKCRKNWGRGREACINKQSQTNYGLVDHYLSSGSSSGSWKVIAIIT
jgi:hypothetical protein